MAAGTRRVLLTAADAAEAARVRALFADAALAGHVLDEAGTLDEALAALDAGRHDACLVAAAEGRRGVLPLLQWARRRGCPTPLLVLAASADRQADLEAQAAGAADYLVLDRTDAAALERALRYAVGRRQAGDAVRGQVRDLERRAFENTVLAEMASLLQTCQRTEQAAAVVSACAARLFPAESGALFLFRDGPGRLAPAAVWGDPCLRPGGFAAEDCIALAGPGLRAGEGPGSVCEHLGCPLPERSLCVPLITQGDVVGVLHLQSGQSPADSVAPLSEAHERLAQAVADQAALALANLQLRQSLREQAIRDPLTGLFNRRHMEESLARELRRAERRQRPLGVILLDLDHFKCVNDTHGHEAGDALLRAVGRFLQTHIRGEDLASRHGGEEFLLILADSSREDTGRRAEQLREGIKALRVEHAGWLGTVTASLGVAVYPEHGLTAEAVVRAADAALYEAKADGRDRVVVGRAPVLVGPHLARFPAPAVREP